MTTSRRDPSPADPARERLDAVLDHLPDVVVRYDRDDVVIHVNRAFEQATGVPREQVIGRRADALAVSPETIEAFAQARRRVYATGQPVTFDIRRQAADGPRYVEYRMIPELKADGSFDSIVAVGRDITERETAREAVELERSRLLHAQTVARLVDWDWDVVNDTSRASPEIVGILGDPAAKSAPVQTFFALLAPEERERGATRMRDIRAQQLPHTEATWRIVQPGGASRHLHVRSVWTFDAAGRLVAGSGSLQDVTEDVEASMTLARQHAMLDESQRLAAVGSWSMDFPSAEITWSAEMFRLAARSPDEMVLSRESIWQIVHPEDAAACRERVLHSLSTGEPTESEWRLLRPDGSIREIQMRTRATLGASGAVVRLFGTCQDITDRRRLEAQVRQSQKLEALGLLAGSIAHDFNNLLTAIIGGSELARLGIADDTDAARDLDEVRQAAARASKLTQQLLAFGRPRPTDPGVVDLREVVNATARLLRRLIPETVALDIITGLAPVTVRADPARIEQVLLNLVLNARDAILDDSSGSDAGVIAIEVSRVVIADTDPRLARSDGLRRAPGDFACLLVRDTGTGMDDATRARLFEPFFTTKPVGKGTGIGLPTVLGIAAQCGGYLDVESAPGAGSTFTLLLPHVTAPVKGRAATRAVLPVGDETILLVEDESSVRETAARILERHGYNVLTARHGNDAVLQWRAHADEIELLLTDLRMPEMGGQDLIATLRAERPSLPVVVMSGYASGRKAGEKELLASELFLAKPFTTESLLVQVRAALTMSTSSNLLR